MISLYNKDRPEPTSRRAAILLFDGLTALDAVGPYEVLSRVPGVEVVFVGEERGGVRTGDGRLGLTADQGLRELPHPEILVVPGGPGTRAQLSNPVLLDWLRGVDKTSEWTTSVCTGSLLLAAAGLLNGLAATTHWQAREELEQLGGRYVSDRVVRHGRLLIAAGVSAGVDMALLLAAELAGREVAQAIQLAIEYDPEPPFVGGSLKTADRTVVELATAMAEERRKRQQGVGRV